MAHYNYNFTPPGTLLVERSLSLNPDDINRTSIAIEVTNPDAAEPLVRAVRFTLRPSLTPNPSSIAPVVLTHGDWEINRAGEANVFIARPLVGRSGAIGDDEIVTFRFNNVEISSEVGDAEILIAEFVRDAAVADLDRQAFDALLDEDKANWLENAGGNFSRGSWEAAPTQKLRKIDPYLRIDSFVASEDGSTISWTTTGASKIEINGIEITAGDKIDADGSLDISAAQTESKLKRTGTRKVYTLRAFGEGESGQHFVSKQIVVDVDDNLGIGTDTPSTAIEVRGAIRAGQTADQFVEIGHDGASGFINTDAGVRVKANDVDLLNITPGSLILKGSVADELLRVTNSDFAFVKTSSRGKVEAALTFDKNGLTVNPPRSSTDNSNFLEFSNSGLTITKNGNHVLSLGITSDTFDLEDELGDHLTINGRLEVNVPGQFRRSNFTAGRLAIIDGGLSVKDNLTLWDEHLPDRQHGARAQLVRSEGPGRFDQSFETSLRFDLNESGGDGEDDWEEGILTLKTGEDESRNNLDGVYVKRLVLQADGGNQGIALRQSGKFSGLSIDIDHEGRNRLELAHSALATQNNEFRILVNSKVKPDNNFKPNDFSKSEEFTSYFFGEQGLLFGQGQNLELDAGKLIIGPTERVHDSSIIAAFGGNVTMEGGLTVGTNLPSESVGLTVTAGGLTVKAGNLTVDSGNAFFNSDVVLNNNLWVKNRIFINTEGDSPSLRSEWYSLESLDSANRFDGRVLLKRNSASSNPASIPEPSDFRLKDNIRPIGGARKLLTSLKGVSFEWNQQAKAHFTADIESTLVAGPGATPEANRQLWERERARRYAGLAGRRLGLIAQDVEAVAPELVTEDKSGYKYIDYLHLNAILVQAFNEQTTLIDTLQSRIARLEGQA